MQESQSQEDVARVEEALSQGPRITFMVYRDEPTSLFTPATFIASLCANFATAIFFLAMLIYLPIPPNRIIFSALIIGLLAFILGDVGMTNWFKVPLDYTIVNGLDKNVGFLLLGSVFFLMQKRSPNLT